MNKCAPIHLVIYSPPHTTPAPHLNHTHQHTPPPPPSCRLPEGGEGLELDLREVMPWRRQYAILVA